jgi:hypothetical protein
MSTSLLYHGIGVRDYRHVRTRYVAGGVVFVIERKPETYRCTACGSANVWRHGVVVRSFRTVPLGSKRVELGARTPRLACQDCGLVCQAAVGFAEPITLSRRERGLLGQALIRRRPDPAAARAARSGPSPRGPPATRSWHGTSPATGPNTPGPPPPARWPQPRSVRSRGR